ncbi:MAG: hypothetical protein HZA24_05830 [Nitrospirae bacterium]|nr:hypothetical protein [Nitrospirota bacterium]
MSKYDPLSEHLRLLREPLWSATFIEIERVLGFRLPNSAKTYQAWWANEDNPTSHVQKLAWMRAGWHIANVDFLRKRVLFRRNGHTGSEPQSSHTLTGSYAPPTPSTTTIPPWERPSNFSAMFRYQWQPIGQIVLDADKKLLFPTPPGGPGVYRFCVREGDKVSWYVGESSSLGRRFANYKTPGPTQQTNLRLNERFTDALLFGGTISVSVIVNTAWIIQDGTERQADFARTSVRRMFENAVLSLDVGSGEHVLNR